MPVDLIDYPKYKNFISAQIIRRDSDRTKYIDFTLGYIYIFFILVSDRQF